MSIKDQIKKADIQGLANIAKNLMAGNCQTFFGFRVFFSYNDTKKLILNLRPEVEWAVIESLIVEVSQ